MALKLQFVVPLLPTDPGQFSEGIACSAELAFSTALRSGQQQSAAERGGSAGLALRALRVPLGQVGLSLAEVFLAAHK